MSTPSQLPDSTTGSDWLSAPYRGPVPIPAWVAKRRAKPRPFRGRELLGLVALVIVVDVALWNGDWFGTGGIAAAFLFVASPVVAFLATKKTQRTARLSILAALIFACAVRAAISPNSATIFSGLALMFAFVVALRVKKTYVPEIFSSVFSSLERVPSRVGAAFQGASRVLARTRVGRFSLAPVLVPLGAAIAFASVFALANPVVARGMSTAWVWFTNAVGFPNPLRIGMWLVTLLFAATLLRPACVKWVRSESMPIEAEANATHVHTARNTLALLNVMFLGYNALDAACLWAGVPPKGTTSQIYAHEGAAWLTVALVMLTAAVGYFFRGALAQDPKAKVARILAYGWMAQGAVLAVGTYRRIAMHVSYSGLSDLRIVGILGTSLVVVGMALVVVKMVRLRTLGWLVRRQLDAFALTFIVYAIFPTHFVSAEVNVARIEHGELRPALHLFRQSQETESVAVLLPLLSHPDDRIRQGTAALLLQKKRTLAESLAGKPSLREGDLTERRTLETLTKAEPQMTAALSSATEADARSVLFDLSTMANEGASLEQLLSLPSATRNEHYGQDTR